MLRRKSLKTGWTVWFPNKRRERNGKRERRKVPDASLGCPVSKAGPMAVGESSWFASLPHTRVFHQLTQRTPTSVSDSSHSNTCTRLGAFFSDLVISDSGRAGMWRLFPVQQILLLKRASNAACVWPNKPVLVCGVFFFLWRGLGCLTHVPFPSATVWW